MKHISQRQGGMTALGIFLILVMLAMFLAFGMKIFPLYNEYIGVKNTMQGVLNQPYERRKSVKSIRKLFANQAQINSLWTFDPPYVKEHVFVKKDKKKRYLNVKYTHSNNLFKNIFLTIEVDESR